MKSILQQIIEKNREHHKLEAAAIKAEIENPAISDIRRSFLKNTTKKLFELIKIFTHYHYHSNVDITFYGFCCYFIIHKQSSEVHQPCKRPFHYPIFSYNKQCL